MTAARKVCDTGGMAVGVLRRKKRVRWPGSRIPDSSDRLVEDARIFLLIIQRQRASYEAAIEGLVRDAFGSADRLRAAAAAARACVRSAAEADLLERAADRIGPAPRRT